MNAIAITIDAGLRRAFDDEYFLWAREQNIDIVSLPAQGPTIEGSITYHQVPAPFLTILQNKKMV